jgi:hypothetical protein
VSSVTDQQTAGDQLLIQRVLFDYAWGCDNGDWKLLRDLFTDDAELDYTTSGGPTGGREEVVGWLEESLSQVGMIQHVVSNFQIDVDGGRAGGRAMFFTSVRLPGATDLLFTGGYYDLEFVRVGDGWKLRRLFEDNRWMSRDPSSFS